MEKENIKFVDSEKKILKKTKSKKKFIFLICIFIFYIIIILSAFLFYKILYLNHTLKHFKSFYENKINDLYNNISFYQEMLKLYIENITEFYIKGRERTMKLYGKNYNESNINTIQDKLNWLIIHDNPVNKTNIVDKILLHEYSKKILGKDICVPILKIYNNSNEIDLNELPDKFVLKCNHGSGMNILCNNKSKLNISNVKYYLNKWMNTNYGLNSFEYQYINIKKKIFAEKYLCDNIKDYKVYCFNGYPKFIRVQEALPNISGKINNYYNLEWNLNDIETGIGNYFIRRPDIIFKKPKYLNLMIEYAKKLSSQFFFVRVDFYEFENTVYLGELTFTPSNIIFNNKNINQSLYLGNLLNISK